MKFSSNNLRSILSILISILVNQFVLLLAVHRKDDIDTNDINSLIMEVNKFNRTIHKQQEMINKLKDYAVKLNEENQQLKQAATKNYQSESVSQIKQMEKNDYSNSYPLTKDLANTINKITEYQTFYQQIEMQIAREKELRETVDSKIREMSQAQGNIDRIYNEINNGVKLKVTELEKKLDTMDKINFDLNQRVFILEKEKEKEKLTRNLQKKGVFSSTVIEPDCINRNSCRVCLEDPKCIWCSIDKKCKLGDMSGPYDGSCLTSFQYSTCVENPCKEITSCSECIQLSSCGWCDNMCVEGTETKPIGILCPNKYVHMNNSERCFSKNTNFLK